MNLRKTVSLAIAYILMSVLLVIYVIPFYWTFLKSFRNSIFANFPPDFNPLSRTSVHYFIQNLRTVWSFGSFPLWYFNSVFVSVCVVAGSVFIGALAGYAFARLKFPGRDILFYAVLATLMIPFPVISIASYVFMLDIHWLSTYQGLIMPQIASALNVFLMRQYFTTIPDDIENAAKIDGLRPWQIFFRISAPIAKPAIAATAIYSFISSWNNFLWPLMEVHSIRLFTLPLVLNFFKGANGTQIYWNQMMTVNILAMIPTLIVFIVFERYFVEGIALQGRPVS
ncbi:sugar ABC transporter ATP-binding protein [Thermogymnomonas acidicola]|uniref:Sugar ABC transporter ATP-binding protein n=1 Tax=Thermogymnomonas acidicola TaxID=399579 RepID=A0AA37F9V2_9ARCH|nr:carbohydrate ABC transporter permease [Thermogymnomonas acidicola]GGM77336.1 sugar ABC transporter ATP-binding protein [Thermogymnomonas acidicola]